MGPEFCVPSACLRTLSQPSDFYDVLLEGCSTARRRVTLSSLYLGTGALEQALLHTLRSRLLEVDDLTCTLHFDLGRTIRRTGESPRVGGVEGSYGSSASLLLETFRGPQGAPSASLARRVKIDLTLLPQLRGVLGALPPRFSEAMGVWHAKAYLFDNHTAVLTGANLSTDYFTTRQDRYVVVSSAGGRGGEEGARAVAEFLAYLHGTIESLGAIEGSHRLLPHGRVQQVHHSDAPAAAEGGGGAEFSQQQQQQQLPAVVYTPLPSFSPLHGKFASELKRLLDSSSSKSELGAGALTMHPPPSSSSSSPPPCSVILRPRWQLGSLDVRHDERALGAFVRDRLRPSPQDSLYLATGYFNLPSPLQRYLIGAARGTALHVLTASPLANGFWGARGVAGAIPLAYCQLERVFYGAAARAGCLMADPEGGTSPTHSAGIALHEYERAGWTFHAKGLWVERRGGGVQAQVQGSAAGSSSSDSDSSSGGMVSLVGSSNYGMRGTHRDLELQVEITTSDPAACRVLAGERDALFSRRHVRAVGAHLASKSGYGRERDVFSASVAPHRALRWRCAWANGAWIHLGYRVLKPFF
jgi:CDP-diacylglycerol--glycerol-3-phosphate 3-phosphatidyltransferase